LLSSTFALHQPCLPASTNKGLSTVVFFSSWRNTGLPKHFSNCFGIGRSQADMGLPRWRRDASRARWPACRLCPCGPCASWCQRADMPTMAIVAGVPIRPSWPGCRACQLSRLAYCASWHAGTLRQELTVKCRIIRYGTLKTVRSEIGRSRCAFAE